jgi:hypothetical protein
MLIIVHVSGFHCDISTYMYIVLDGILPTALFPLCSWFPYPILVVPELLSGRLLFFSFMMILGFELMGLHLLGRCSIT